jgi:hypothetical protein
MTDVAALVLVFNRPEITLRLVDALRAAKPARLFVAADGPRPGHPTDGDLCRRTREAFAAIDWPCEVHMLFHDENLGPGGPAVIAGFDWFFEHVDAGIILEDDDLPAPEFLPFAAELLQRYADVPRVMHISGLNMRPHERVDPHSYFFAEVGHHWGWATWRRAWQLFDPTFRDWPEMRRAMGRGAPALRRALGRKCASAYAGRKRTWSRAWYYTMLRHHGLAVIPSVNMIENVGFGPDATNTKSRRHPLRVEVGGAMTFPLDHPEHMVPNARYERHLARYHSRTVRRRPAHWARSVLGGAGGGLPR